MIGHARGLVESFLEARVRERVGELARAELGEVREDWLDRAGHQHDLRLDRPRAIVTIPAYFTNNQKHATRDACAIAGVDLVRMIHEPTAACMTAARERRLTGRIVVVDLGAGTLDLSFLEVDDNAYDVQQVVGDTRFGGQDFDQRISTALAGLSVLLPATPGCSSSSAPVRASSRRSTSGTATTFSAADSAASAYRSGRFLSAAMTTASTEISADCAMYSRTWSRASAWRNMPNSSSSMTAAITLAAPT